MIATFKEQEPTNIQISEARKLSELSLIPTKEKKKKKFHLIIPT